MAETTLGRLFLLAVLYISVSGDTFSIPEVKVEAFTPKGLRVTLPDAPNIVLFAVQGLLKRDGQTEKIDISGETASKVHIGDKDYWIVELPDLELKPNDRIDYLTFVAVNSAGYIKDDLKFTVETLKDYVPLSTTTTTGQPTPNQQKPGLEQPQV